jgi:hypothetical protein
MYVILKEKKNLRNRRFLLCHQIAIRLLFHVISIPKTNIKVIAPGTVEVITFFFGF